MGIYLSEHPLDPYESVLETLSKYRMGDLAESSRDIKSGVFVGMVSNVTIKLTRTGKHMATFMLEDTTGSIEALTFKYDDMSDIIVEDAIVKVKGKFEHGDRGNQIIIYEAEALELNEEDARPKQFELRVPASSFDAPRVQKLNRILQEYPGRDYVVLFVLQNDGRRFRAELPVTVDSTNNIMKSEIQDLFGAVVW